MINAAAGQVGNFIRVFAKRDNVNIINIVRRDKHVDLLRNAGQKYVVSSRSDNYSDELKEILYPEGITTETPVITYCNTGKSSSLIYFAYRLVGHKQVASYDGGIIEWCADESLPVSAD